MCYGIEVLLWDILVVIGLILLVIWILDIANVWNVATGPWKHAFLVVGVLFLIMWVLVRCCGCCTGGRRKRRNAVIV
ncbi:hypothetical protein HDU87_006356 [Geranomyces variabilis]|uniref:Uncharacterized protein n=1 Tax=Geranomyces variabilis TaxID=109894 RepID=A0AAD5TFZ6_9FUNG|nr:hypothetical protein HDU87_006356 [Geranomyces variabilis]